MCSEILNEGINHVIQRSFARKMSHLCTEKKMLQFPGVKTILWDHTATSAPQQLHLANFRPPKLNVSEKVLRLVLRHLGNTVDPTFSCILIGSCTIDEDGQGVSVVIDQFDRGQHGDGNTSLCPTTQTPGDVLVPFQAFRSKKKSDVSNVENLLSAFKFLHHRCSSKDGVDLGGFLLTRGRCWSSVVHDMVTCHVEFDLVCPATEFLATQINPVPIVPTALSKNLSGPMSIHHLQGTPKTGYLTMDHTRKLLLVLESDPKVYGLPLVGIWVSGVPFIYSPFVWASCQRYISNQVIQDRVCEPPEAFLLVLYSPLRSKPEFYECTTRRGNNNLDFSIYTVQDSIQLFKTMQPGEVKYVELNTRQVTDGPKLDPLSAAQEAFKQQMPSEPVSDTGQGENPFVLSMDEITPRVMPLPQPTRMPVKDTMVPDVSLMFLDNDKSIVNMPGKGVTTSSQHHGLGPAYSMPDQPYSNVRPDMPHHHSIPNQPTSRPTTSQMPSQQAYTNGSQHPRAPVASVRTVASVNGGQGMGDSRIRAMLPQRPTLPYNARSYSPQTISSAPGQFQRGTVSSSQPRQPISRHQFPAGPVSQPGSTQQQFNPGMRDQYRRSGTQGFHQQTQNSGQHPQTQGFHQQTQNNGQHPQTQGFHQQTQNSGQHPQTQGFHQQTQNSGQHPQAQGFHQQTQNSGQHPQTQGFRPQPQTQTVMGFTQGVQSQGQLPVRPQTQMHGTFIHQSQIPQPISQYQEHPRHNVQFQPATHNSVPQMAQFQRMSTPPTHYSAQSVSQQQSYEQHSRPQYYNNVQYPHYSNLPQTFQPQSQSSSVQNGIPQQSQAQQQSNTFPVQNNPHLYATNPEQLHLKIRPAKSVNFQPSQNSPNYASNLNLLAPNGQALSLTALVQPCRSTAQAPVLHPLHSQSEPCCNNNIVCAVSDSSSNHGSGGDIHSNHSNAADSSGRSSQDSGLSVTPDRPISKAGSVPTSPKSLQPSSNSPSLSQLTGSPNFNNVPPEVYQLLLHQDSQLKQMQAQIQELLKLQSPKPTTSQTPSSPLNTCAVAINTSLFDQSKTEPLQTDHESTGVQTSPLKSTLLTRVLSPVQAVSCTPPSKSGATTPAEVRHRGPPQLNSTARFDSGDVLTSGDLTAVMNNVGLDRTNNSIQSDMIVDLPSFISSPTRSRGSKDDLSESPISASMIEQHKETSYNEEDVDQECESKEYYNQLMVNIHKLLHPQSGEDETISHSNNTANQNGNGYHYTHHEGIEDGHITRNSTEIQPRFDDTDSPFINKCITLSSEEDKLQSLLRFGSPMNAMDTTFIPKINYVSMFLDSESDTSMEINAMAMKYLKDEQLTQMAKLRTAACLNGIKNGKKSALLQQVMESGSKPTPNVTQCGISPTDLTFATKKYMEKYGLLNSSKSEQGLTVSPAGHSSAASTPVSRTRPKSAQPTRSSTATEQPSSNGHHSELYESYINVISTSLTKHVYNDKNCHSPSSPNKLLEYRMRESIIRRTPVTPSKRTAIQPVSPLIRQTLQVSPSAAKQPDPELVGKSQLEIDNILDVSRLKQLPKLL